MVDAVEKQKKAPSRQRAKRKAKPAVMSIEIADDEANVEAAPLPFPDEKILEQEQKVKEALQDVLKALARSASAPTPETQNDVPRDPKAQKKFSEHSRKIYEALNEVFEYVPPQDEHNPKPYETSYQIEALAVNYSKIEKRDGEVHLVSDTSSLVITKNKVEFAGHAGKDASFTAQDAYSMMMAISQNPRAFEKGLKLKGTGEGQSLTAEEERLMRGAMEQVNRELPPGKQLHIAGEKRVSVEPAHEDKPAQEEKQMTGFLGRISSAFFRKAKDAGPIEAANDSEAVADAEIVEEPSDVVEATAPEVAEKQDVLQAKTEQPVEVPTAKQETPMLTRRGLFRLAGMGAVAMAAGSLITPDHAEAAALPQAKRTFWQKFISGKWHDESEAKHMPVPQKKPHQSVKHDTVHKPKQHHAAHDKHHDKHDMHAKKTQRHPATPHKDKPVANNNALSKKQQHVAEEAPPKKGWFGGSSNKTGGVWIQNTHNDERMYLDFCALGTCSNKFNSFARDWRKNKAIDMDRRLLSNIENVVTELRRMGYPATQVNLVSGYRTPATNAMLQNKGKELHGSSGVASSSFHMRGMAMDFTVSGVSTKVLHSVTCKMVASSGGVGYYPVSAFVHMDTRGRGARWAGA